MTLTETASLRSNTLALWGSMVLAMRNFFADPQWIIPSIVAPFLFTVVTLYLYGPSAPAQLLYVVLGGAFMGMWGTTVYNSANSLAFDRWNGTLETTLGAPTPMIWVAMGRVLWNTFVGLLNAFLILIVGLLWLGRSSSIHDPVMFVLASAVTFVSLSSLGLFLTTAYVMTRKALFLSNALEFPLYIATGTMFPIALLPFASQGVALALGPTWGFDAIRVAALHGYQGIGTSVWVDLLITVAETVATFGLAWMLFQRVERRARSEGDLGRI